MNNSLVVWFNRGGMMENHNFSFEIVHRFGVERFIKENHTFSETRTFKCIFFHHAFDGEADGLTGASCFNGESFVMNRFDYNRFENTSFIGSEVENLIWNDGTSFECTSNDETNSSYLINAIDVKFYWITRSLKDSGDRYARLDMR